jgi:hypothetical protein
MRLNKLTPKDVMQWHAERRISQKVCAQMLENTLLEKDMSLLNKMAKLYSSAKKRQISLVEYCTGLYELS